MRFSTRQLVTLAVFGTLWGLVEISLGALFHFVKIPFTGAVLSAIGLGVALIGRFFVPKPGSTLFIGVIAMILKLFSIGSVVVGPMIGILMEALVAEIILSTMGKPSRASFILAGSAGVTWTLIQPFFTGLLLFGRNLFVVWLDLIDAGSRFLGIPTSSALWVFLALLTIHIILGALAGYSAWGLGKQLILRMEGVVKS